MEYQVKIDIFEGPMDLLLYLIRKNDLDIYDIPIAQITAEYLDYVEALKMFNLDSVGEFMVMAATLLQIKSRMLLPTQTSDEEGGVDPRAELIAKLLEYQKYKKASQLLQQRAEIQRDIFSREETVFQEDDYVLESSIFDLLTAFRKAITQAREEIKEIVYEEIPLETKIREIMSLLETKQYLTFSELFVSGERKIVFVITFIAILELIRLKQISARQSQLFDEIRIYKIEPSSAENEPVIIDGDRANGN